MHGFQLKSAALVAAALLMVAISGPVAAAQNAKPAKATDNWVVNCSSVGGAALKCRMSQTIMVAKTRQRILSAVIFHKPASADLVMRVALPHGIYLPAGVTVKVDNTPGQTYVIETADRNGSYASIPLDRKLLAALKAGQKLVFALQNMAGKTVKIELSLVGFSASLAQIRG